MKSLVAVQREVFDFLSIEPGMKVAIVCDNDEDGLTAAVQMRLFLEMSGCETKTFFYDHNTKIANFFSSFLRNIFDRTVFLDLNETFISDVLKEVGKNTGKCLIIDHHQELDVTNAFFDFLKIKPWDFSKVEPSHYPASKMVFDLFGGIDWICAIGVIGDFSFKEWASFLKQVRKKHSLSEKQMDDLAGITACVVAYHNDKIHDLFDFLCSAKSPTDLFASWFAESKKEFDDLLEQERQRFFREATYIEDAEIYFYETKPRLRSKLSTLLSKDIPNKTLMIYEDHGFMVGASLRRSDFKINCGEVSAFAVNGARDGRGGGHIPAAAATFRRTYLSSFKDKILLYLRTNYPLKKSAKQRGKIGGRRKKIKKK